MATQEAGYRMDEMRPRFQRITERHTNGTAPQAVSAYQLFQTPAALARRLTELARIQPGETILEPSAGLGRILDTLAPTGNRITAVEINKDCAAALYAQDRPNVTILQRDFLTVEPFLVDVVVMNPPFHLRDDIRHIEHALRFGGRLVAVCMGGEIRRTWAQSKGLTFEPLPSGSFRSEGTNIETAIVRNF